MAKNKSEKPKYKRVLIARFSALGDVAMTIPVVYSACMENPETEFCMLTSKPLASLFVNAPANLRLLGIDKHKYDGPMGLYRLYREIKSDFNPDAFVDLHAVLRTHLLSIYFFFHGVKVKQIDKGRKGKRALTRSRGKRLLPLINSRARYREVFHRIGFNINTLFKSLFNGKHADPSEFSDIISLPKCDETWIAIAPFAKHKGKIYPLEKMEIVVEKLSCKPKYRIFLLGSGKREEAVLQAWADGCANIQSLAGRHFGFRKELALLSNCDAMISMDSANMHMASLVNLPVVSVWGATHPYCGFMGWRQSEDNSVQLNLTCRPCSVFGNKPCRTGDYFCLNGISPELILSTLQRMLNK